MSFSQYLPLLAQLAQTQIGDPSQYGSFPSSDGGSSGGLSGSAASNGAGLSGLMSLFGGGAAGNGDSGLTSQVANQTSGLNSVAHAGDMSTALGSSPTGLFSGLNPGGGMSQTASGALGGGISGQAAGASQIGGSSMTPGAGNMSNVSGLLGAASSLAGSGQQTPSAPAGRAHVGNGTMAQIAQMYGLPAGLLSY